MNRRFLIALCLLACVFVLRMTTAPARGAEWEFPKDWFWHDDDAQRAKHAELLGKPAPQLDLADWKNGEVKAEDMKGKVVVLDFWATWCGPCIASIPHNNELSAKWKDKGVVFVGVCTANGQENFQKVVEEKGIKYSVAHDPNLKSQEAWRVMWYPTYAVVDRKGVLRAIGLKPEFVEKVVEKLAAEGAQARTGRRPVMYAFAGGDVDKGAAWREGDDARRKQLAELEGKAPPELMVQNWVNGSEMKLSDLKGKVVLLDFWATWCGPCIASIPHTNELMEKYKDKGLVVIGVCHSEGADKMPATVADKQIKYTVAADIDGKTVKEFNVDSFPDYYLIDRAGKLRIADCANGSVDEAVEALLAESATASAQ